MEDVVAIICDFNGVMNGYGRDLKDFGDDGVDE